MWPVHINLPNSEVYSKSAYYEVSYRKEGIALQNAWSFKTRVYNKKYY